MIVITVACLLSELLVLLVVGEVPKFPRRVVQAPWGLRYNDPGAHYRHKSADGTWNFHINNQGMRADRDYTYQKPPGVKRIVNLGDSFTIGFEVDLEQNYSSVLERELIAAGMQVEVLNTGVSGFSNAEAYLYLERELLKYEPDLVCVSFWYNDPLDNIRSDLFRLEGDRLVKRNKEYIPMGKLANFLNTNWVFNVLSEHSNAFVFLKGRITGILKNIMDDANERELQHAVDQSASVDRKHQTNVNLNTATREETDYQQRLTAAIFERIYMLLRQKHIPLLILNIPTPYYDRDDLLVEEFPLPHFDVNRAGVTFFPAKEVLNPYVNEELLHWERSQFHWTPFSHEQVGKALTGLILDLKLLR